MKAGRPRILDNRQARGVAIPIGAQRILRHLTAIQRRRAEAFLLGSSVAEIARRDGVSHQAISWSLCAPSVARALRDAGTITLNGTDALEYILSAVLAWAHEVRSRNCVEDDDDRLQLMSRFVALMYGSTEPLRKA